MTDTLVALRPYAGALFAAETALRRQAKARATRCEQYGAHEAQEAAQAVAELREAIEAGWLDVPDPDPSAPDPRRAALAQAVRDAVARADAAIERAHAAGLEVKLYRPTRPRHRIGVRCIRYRVLGN